MSSLEPDLRVLKKSRKRKSMPGDTIGIAVLALIVCCTALLAAGCTKPFLSGTGINAPIVIQYTVSNPLIIQEVPEPAGAGFDYRYIRISGLRDQKVEQAVNRRIKAVYDELRTGNLPPYRGIRKAITEDMILNGESVQVTVSGNYNNILSIIFHKYSNYQSVASDENSGFEKEPEYHDGSRYLSEAETLNIDLNTGREITLKDLFCDNVDEMALINDRMVRYLSENHADDEGYYPGSSGDLKLVESFKGLDEDQKFAVYPYGITFVFDYRTPEFETGGMAVCPTFFFSDFGDTIAASARFFREDHNIYISDGPLIKVLPAANEVSDITGSGYFRIGGINIYQSWSYSSKLPEEIKRRLDRLKEPDPQRLKEIKPSLGDTPAKEIAEKGTGAYEIIVSADRVGEFINIAGYYNLYSPKSYEQVLDFHCYDSGTLEELRLEDLFADGYDFKPVVTEAIRKALVNYDGTYDERVMNPYSDMQIDGVISEISGFHLMPDAVVIPIRHPEKGNQTFGLSITIPYQDFGCDNMKIFR